MEPGFDPASTMLLEENESHKLSWEKPNVPLDKPVSIKNILQTPEKEVWEITTAQSGFLVFSNTYYHGWQATLNNSPVPILRAYGLFRAIQIPLAGTYSLTFTYHPSFLKIMAGEE